MSPDASTTAVDSVLIKVAGQPLQSTRMAQLFQVEVESSLDLPSMAAITFHDNDTGISSGSDFAIGSALEVHFPTPANPDTKVAVFKGEITAIEPRFEEDFTATVVIRAYDKSHRLNRASQIRTFTNVKASDVVQQLISGAGLTPDVTTTSEVFDYLIVRGQTALQFITGMAARYNFEAGFDGDKYFFRPQQVGTEVATLAWGENLRTFYPRLSAAAQPAKALTRGWDTKKGDVVVGEASSATNHVSIGEGKTGPQRASSFGDAKYYTLAVPVSSQSEAGKLAQGALDAVNADSFDADGTLFGDPSVVAGKTIKIDKVGTRFNGKYRVTSATHSFTPEGGYLTTFRVEGARRRTLSALLGAGASADDMQQALAHIMPAIVTDNNDPDSLGRVKVRYPLLSDELESFWAPVVTVGGGQKTGLFWLPSINDHVLVAFQQGDINRPFVLGGLYSQKHQPPLQSSDAVAGGTVKQYLFKTRSGHQIAFGDDSGKSFMQIKSQKGDTITIDDTAKAMEMKTGGKFSGQSTQDMELKSSAGLTAKANSTITIESSGSLTIKGATISIEANGPLTLKGAVVQIN